MSSSGEKRVNLQEGQFVQLLGMHRSGTSCLAGCLQAGGLYLGEVNENAGFNKKGNRENSSFVNLHEDVLKDNQFTWNSPPSNDDNLVWSKNQINSQKLLTEDLRQCAGQKSYGFKDPRSLIFIDKWKRFDPTYIGTFRHPAAVMRSLTNRAKKWGQTMSPSQALDLWITYNANLLKLYDQRPFPIIQYGQIGEEYLADIYAILLYLDLDENYFAAERFFENDLKNFNESDDELPADCQNLWTQLLELPRPSEIIQTSSEVRRFASLNNSDAAKIPNKISEKAGPLVSFIIVCYEMSREVPRTVLSCLKEYQSISNETEIEIIVVDNGSKNVISESVQEKWPDYVRHICVKNPNASPARAVNLGVSEAKGKYVGIIVDGARILSSGIVERVRQVDSLFPNPFITTLGYHLGDKIQQDNAGYNAKIEDELLNSIEWPNTPSRLFDISCLSGTSKGGLLNTSAESNAFFIKREHFLNIGGYNEEFVSSGGGYVNLDFFNRAVSNSPSNFVLLTDQGSFHQVHGGVSTTYTPNNSQFRVDQAKRWKDEFKAVTSRDYQRVMIDPYLFGSWPDKLLGMTAKEIRRRKSLRNVIKLDKIEQSE